MKKLFPLLLLLLAVHCYAQDKATVVSKRMFITGADDVVPLSQLDGWFFKPGNDTAWARTDINMAGWQKLRPKELSAKNADKNGRVEGWFRIKLKPDSTVNAKGLSIGYNSYAPADIYTNGKRIGSYGYTGLFGHPYVEYDADLLVRGFPLNLKQGEQFTLAIHIVDTLAPIGHRKLKSEWTPTVDYIYLGNPDSDYIDMAAAINSSKNYAIWFSVCLTLCVLFWLMALLNRREKVFLYIAGCSTFFVPFIYFQWLNNDLPSCSAFIIYVIFIDVSLALMLASLPVVIAKIFKRRILLWVKIALAAFTVYNSVFLFLPWDSKIVAGANVLFSAGICLYYIISSWKNARGAQWCIIGGMLATFFFLLCLIVVSLFHVLLFTDKGLGFFLFTAFFLSFPFSLLVYVAVRFKEIINEVRANAAEVVQLSEEKKEEALNRQKTLEEEVNRQTAEIRANQARLIQSEKMASLGELTAGIAHEIQNPLNFVNNFSEVNTEMFDELEDELKQGNITEAIQLAADMKQNEEKIRHHGKRADVIVKGMLEHSRTSTGEKQPTNINVLTEEFLKLSYHGLRAKDKEFNADLVTHLDKQLPKINIAQQDIGRVLINLFNNAFYAVNQKKKTAGADYKPEVSVCTMSENGSVVIKVKDNGNGIPDGIKDKIMQPFFTTKPTGEGTGLGLSLSYDIVVKGHSGSIKVETKQGEGTEFIVDLPLANKSAI
ncbi:MAG TPA: MFS domain-containing histidine kinase [Mucilaginibacter sp.]|jgi:signal transduction histidine kinase|nr:MFS domain-containing histidine kinase [Mucilaginibacter sp.]